MSEHTRQPMRMLGRQVQPPLCSCGGLWPCAVATGAARWQALEEYIAKALRDHHEVAVSCTGRELAATRHHQEGIVEAYRDALAKMRELTTLSGSTSVPGTTPERTA